MSSMRAERANMATARGSPGMGGCSRRGLSQRMESKREEMRPRGRLGKQNRAQEATTECLKKSAKVNILTAIWKDSYFVARM